jgi:hypothetical protein
MNFSVVNNRLKLSNSYDVSGSINTTSLLVGTDIGINPSSTLDVLSLEQQVNNINSTNTANGGQASSVGGQTEVYATLEIQRIA